MSQAKPLSAGGEAGSRDDQSTHTMKVELKDIPREFQRSIEQNLRISRAASERQK